ncbi:MAG: CBS domain-containing protein [Anaerolineae bacterium]|nr:CBS domain-containing protein [Anaerolineae bacterium]
MSPLTSSWQHPQCTPDTPLTEVARQIEAQKADHILVYAGERLLGIITRDDVLRCGERGGLRGITADMAYRPL